MSIVSVEELSIGYRGPLLLDSVSCRIEENERIGLLGRNGAGKTTFMRLLSGTVEADSGQIHLSGDSRIRLLQQDVPSGINKTIVQLVSEGLTPDPSISEPGEEWREKVAVDEIITRMELEPDANFETLSSGMKRRVLLAQAIVSKPDLLLLDEPTNHLDIEAIQWLEEFLKKWPASLIFVTHDRMFLRRMATRILEIDRGKLFDWTCDYDTFLQRKEQALAAEEKQNALFDKRLAEEEAWIRQGIKARRTRNEGRVRDLKKMRLERTNRREQLKTSNLKINEAQKSGQLVIEADDIAFEYDSQKVFSDLSVEIMRGDKVGIIGRNGAGKTTLLKVLLGQIEPSHGKVRLGSNLEIAYFDQLREQLDEEKSVQDNVGDGYDHVGSGDSRKHILGYLQEFLFAPERSRTLVKFLSGGERNRILLAKLFTKKANVIVLDEPTNDLDTETLEMLEQRLVAFNGTILVVSHDREFLNNVVTSSLVFENGEVKEYVGGFDDWVRQRPELSGTASVTRKSKKPKPPKNQEQPRKLNFKEKQELENLPGQIEELESNIAEIHETIAHPSFYKQDGDKIAAEQNRLKELQQKLDDSYLRWEELEAIASL